jgi:hypothetical protein
MNILTPFSSNEHQEKTFRVAPLRVGLRKFVRVWTFLYGNSTDRQPRLSNQNRIFLEER